MNTDLTDISNLPLIDEYNRHFRSTTYKKLILTHEWNQWFNLFVQDDEWNLFTCTVVFRPVDQYNSKERYESDYKYKVLGKVKNRLERHPARYTNCIPFEHFYYFEREQKSIKKLSSKKCPFHVHSLLPIKTCHYHRFWNQDDSSLNSRLMKDLLSIDVVQDVLIEPIRDSESINWISYITKSKEL
jgi:hypothetical protein